MVLFSEDHIQETRRRGRIEVICGSMFSGKTEELIRRLKRAKFARQRVEIFKPAIITLIPLFASWLHTSIKLLSKNCASSIPTTSISEVNNNILADESIGVEEIALLSCETTSASE